MDTRTQIFKEYNLSPEAQIGKGMEADVYDYGNNTVLKIYAGTATFDDLITLKDFYNSIERTRVHYALPHIYSVTQEYDHVVTIEQKLAGRPMSASLPPLNNRTLDGLMREYLKAASALANIRAPNDLTQLKLYDPNQLSQSANGDWNRFLQRYLRYRLVHVSPYLERDVKNFSEKSKRLDALLESPYEGDYKLIHGDFCPSNLLINDQNRVSALIDFGMLTMYGDHLFDLATSWVFFDMYDELKANIYDRFRAILLESIGVDQRGALYRYILIYSILSANSYSVDCTDGHYQWCVANLSNAHYWKHLA